MSALVADPDAATLNGRVSMRIGSHARLGQRARLSHIRWKLALCPKGQKRTGDTTVLHGACPIS